MSNSNNIAKLGRAVIRAEATAIEALLERIDQSFEQACEIMLSCRGRVVVIGMGKSGHIGNKIAATLASTGTPAFFVHPGEASHGDLGMVTESDVVITLSNSGETSEVLMILPVIKRLGIPMVAMTGNPNSTLAQGANIHLDVSVEKEACPLGLDPHLQHHRRTGDGRCTGGSTTGESRLYRRRFRPISPCWRIGTTTAAANQ